MNMGIPDLGIEESIPARRGDMVISGSSSLNGKFRVSPIFLSLLQKSAERRRILGNILMIEESLMRSSTLPLLSQSAGRFSDEKLSGGLEC